MIIKSLTVSGFRTIKNELSLKFPEGIIGIFGENESGKTTLLDAIFVGLYGFPKGKAKTERDIKNNLVNWQSRSANIIIEFEIGEEKFKIRRYFTEKQHKCELYQFDGNKYMLITNNISEVSDYMLELTGMDRDSFAKLVYIRQKDLDSLVELSKNSREAMLNKVMGIEIFDKIIKKAKEDLKYTKNELIVINERFEKLKEYLQQKRQLDEKIKQLGKQIKELERKIGKLDIELKDWKQRSNQLKWLKQEKDLKEKIEASNKELENIQEQLQNLRELLKIKEELEQKLKPLEGIEEKLENLEKIRDAEKERHTLLTTIKSLEDEVHELQSQKTKLDDFKTNYYQVYEHLNTIRGKIETSNVEAKLLKTKLSEIQKQLNKLIDLYNISAVEEIEGKYKEVQVQYPKTRNQLILTISAFLIGILTFTSLIIAVPIIWSIIPAIITVTCGTFAYYVGKKFLLIKRQKDAFHKYEQLKIEKTTTESELSAIQQNISQMLEKEHLKSTNELEDKITSIITQLKKECKLNTFDELTAELKQIEKEIKKTTRKLNERNENLSEVNTKLDELYRQTGEFDDLEAEIKKSKKQAREKDRIEGRLNEVSKNISKLKKENWEKKEEKQREKISKLASKYEKHLSKKPEIPEHLTYSEQAENEAESNIEELNGKISQLKETLAADKREKTNDEKNRNTLTELLKPYDDVKQRKFELETEKKVLEQLIAEISEISAQLRNRVLPVATMKINQILPILTKNRYSSLEISEDLKFMVYTLDSSDLKPRELFSGGTQDQFLIALRLAFTESIITSRISSEEFALLMDECISSSDEYRREQIFNVLKASKQTFKQIFIVAHENISNYVEHYLELGLDNNSSTTIVAKSW